MHPNQSEPQNQILQTLLKSKITIVLRNKKNIHKFRAQYKEEEQGEGREM